MYVVFFTLELLLQTWHSNSLKQIREFIFSSIYCLPAQFFSFIIPNRWTDQPNVFFCLQAHPSGILRADKQPSKRRRARWVGSGCRPVTCTAQSVNRVTPSVSNNTRNIRRECEWGVPEQGLCIKCGTSHVRLSSWRPASSHLPSSTPHPHHNLMSFPEAGPDTAQWRPWAAGWCTCMTPPPPLPPTLTTTHNHLLHGLFITVGNRTPSAW